MTTKESLQSGQISYLYSQLGLPPVPTPIATNLAGGIASQIPFQSAPNTTSFIPNGTAGQVLTSNGTSAPSFATIPAVSVSTNLAGGIASQIPFQSAPNTTSFIPNGTAGQVLTSNGTSAPSFATLPAVSVDTIQQVLTAGNTAQAPLTLVINDTPNTTFTTLKGTSLDIEFDDGVTPNFAEYSAFGINHNGDSLTLGTNGILGFSSNNITSNSGGLNLISSIATTSTNPILKMENTNATAGNTSGVPVVEYFKSGRNTALNDIVMSQQFNAKAYNGVKTTFGKIECSVTGASTGSGVDGALDFYTCINGVNQNVWRLNGNDNENNTFRPLDMNGQILKTSTLDLLIDATTSTGTGIITLKPKSNIVFQPESVGGDLIFTGVNIQSASASGASGFYLKIKLNGVYYKIALELN